MSAEVEDNRGKMSIVVQIWAAQILTFPPFSGKTQVALFIVMHDAADPADLVFV